MLYANIPAESPSNAPTFFKISFRTAGPISINLCTKYSLVMGIQVCLNEGPRPVQRGDNNEIAKIYLLNLSSKIGKYDQTELEFSLPTIVLC